MVNRLGPDLGSITHLNLTSGVLMIKEILLSKGNIAIMEDNIPCYNCITKPICRLKFFHEVFKCPLLLNYMPKVKLDSLYDFRRDVYLHLEPTTWKVNHEGAFVYPKAARIKHD